MQLKDIIELINDSNMSDRRKEYAIYKLRKIAMNPRWRKTFHYNKDTRLLASKFIWGGINNNVSLVSTPIKQRLQIHYWSKIYFEILTARVKRPRKVTWDTSCNPFHLTCKIGPGGIVIPHFND